MPEVNLISLGISGSLVFGVPLGVVVSEWLGWQMTFGLLAVLSLLIMIAITYLVPSLSGGTSIPLKEQLSVLRNRKIASGFFVTLFWIAGYAMAYTFLTPFLRETVHMDTSAISMTMFVIGVFAMTGSRLGGYGADQWGVAKIVLFSMTIHALALIFLPVFNTTIITAVVMVAIWIGSAWMTSPALQTYFIQQTPQSPDLALSLNTSVLQFGIALGAGMGGMIVNSTGTVINTPWVGGGIVLLGIVSAFVSFSIQTKRAFEQV